MILPDVNVLIYAFRKDSEKHDFYHEWLLSVIEGESQYGYSEQVLSSVIRICTNPKVFKNPSAPEEVFRFVNVIREQTNAIALFPSENHWSIFSRLCKESGAKGNIIADAYLAALAIEHGCHFATTDHDFTRFRKLKWFHPLIEKQN